MNEIVALPIIATIVYFIMEIYKKIVSTDKALKFIPAIAATIGAILGIVIFLVSPQLINCETIFHAIIIGLVSGLSAVGLYQIKHQAEKSAVADTLEKLSKTENSVNETNTDGNK